MIHRDIHIDTLVLIHIDPSCASCSKPQHFDMDYSTFKWHNGLLFQVIFNLSQLEIFASKCWSIVKIHT